MGKAMWKWLKRIVLTLVVVVVVLVAGLLLFAPEEYVVNITWGDFFGAPSVDEVTAGQRLQVAEGYHLSVYARDVENARMLLPVANGDLIVSSPATGSVLVLAHDADSDGNHDGSTLLLDGLDSPHGLAFHNDGHTDWLYVAEVQSIGRVRYNPEQRTVEGEYHHVITGLPTGGNHWRRNIHFGPDGKLYVSVGSSCNVCEEDTPLRAAMLRYNPNGSGMEIYASGLRNSTGFDWDHAGQMFAVDNGRDLLGDDFPPCELNAVSEGKFYGWPYANGDNIPDPDLGAGNKDKILSAVPPVHDFMAHTAPLSIKFLTHSSHPDDYQGSAIVALHGSWNRSKKSGYKLVSLHWGEDGSITERDFVSGFEQDEDVIGRPVDVAEAANGDLFVSDDYSNTIYRISTRDAGGQLALAAVDSVTEPAAETDVTETPLSEVEVQQLLAQGEVLVSTYRCVSCHQPANYLGFAKRGLGDKYSRASLAQMFSKPPAGMPRFPLSDEDRLALSVYLLKTY